MKTLLSKSVLNRINRTLYGSGAKVVFYSVTPSAGEQEIGQIVQGFTLVREQRTQGRDGTSVKMLLAHDAGITRDTLDRAASVAVTIDNKTTRYAIDELLPQQQIGAGYVLRLMPQKGATS
jgi:hypothetical protein